MYSDVIFAGSGGQGVLSMGKLLAYAAMEKGREVTWFPYYGAERRGGISFCTVVISSEEIASPVVAYPQSAVVLDRFSWEHFQPLVKPGGLLIINQSLVEKTSDRSDLEVYRFSFTHLAQHLGDARIANMIALGAFVEKTQIVPIAALLLALEKIFENKLVYQKNLQAIEMGRNLLIGR